MATERIRPASISPSNARSERADSDQPGNAADSASEPITIARAGDGPFFTPYTVRQINRALCGRVRLLVDAPDRMEWVVEQSTFFVELIDRVVGDPATGRHGGDVRFATKLLLAPPHTHVELLNLSRVEIDPHRPDRVRFVQQGKAQTVILVITREGAVRLGAKRR